jgi:hypothetical protein
MKGAMIIKSQLEMRKFNKQIQERKQFLAAASTRNAIIRRSKANFALSADRKN